METIVTNLPVSEIVLYKHGVGFFKRSGSVEQDALTLTFRHDEINDVLKSLVVIETGKGHVAGIHYQTPLNKAARLADSSIHLSERATLLDLLRDLRGRMVVLTLADSSIQGQLLGIDHDLEAPLEDTRISLMRADDQHIQVLRLDDLTGLRLQDERARHDLGYFLDTSLSEEIRRSVTVRLSPAEEHELVVYYVAPAPTWRVSYRLVAESDEDGGIALIQGWGLFDNRLDEDLEDVQVTLVAGQPISFIYDLYSSRIPERPVIEEEARTAPGPVEFKAKRRASANHLIQPMAAPEPAAEAGAMADRVGAGLRREEMAESAVTAARGEEAGEFFQYVVTRPVTVKRGDSALVPILNAEIGYSRELLYNGAKLPDHPVAALRFDNATGLTLERGPATVIEDGDYKGEAVVPFTRPGNDVYLAFAVELGIKVTERRDNYTEIASLDIQDRYLIVNEYRVQTTTYLVENTTGQGQTVTIEAPIRAQFELFDTLPPTAETATERRWQIAVPAHADTEFIRSERHLTRRHEQLRSLSYRQLERFMQGRWLDDETYDQLKDLLDYLTVIEQSQAEQQQLKSEREEIYERQSQLRENLTALQPEGQEGTLRARVLTRLEATEDRLEAIDTRLNALRSEIDAANARIEHILDDLGRG